jgi:DNA-binding SARP family transcriptional activator
MRFAILGPLEANDGERPVALGGDKQRALLALLLIHANRTVSAERLIDELWDERPPQTAAKTLQVHVSRLRKVLAPLGSGGEGVVVTRTHGYELTVPPESIDAMRFERLVGEARAALATSRFGPAVSSLEDALSLWRGPALDEFAYTRAAQTEITRLEELRLGAREDLIEAKLALGRHGEVVGELEGLLSEHPYRERLRAQLMLALYRCERQAEALQAYQDARRSLVEDLGIEPGERLRDLERAILNQSESLAFVQPDPGEQADAGQQAGFVGRERELQALLACLDDARGGRGRLVLVSGEPGIGKSRLIDELIGAALTSQARVLIGRCWEAGGAPAYWPWVQSLRLYVRNREPEALRAELSGGAADLAQILPEVRERLPGIPDPPALDPELARFRLFDATAEFLRRASAVRPLVVVLDDLHAADAPSLLLLRFLARELGAMRLLILAAFRDVSPIPSEPMSEMIAEVSREPITRRIRLIGLSQGEIEQYLKLSASPAASCELAPLLCAQTDGNPLFVGEIVRLFHLQGTSPAPGPGPPLAIPPTVREVISRRLGVLSPECQQVLQLGAVVGREFSVSVLGCAADLTDDELLTLLDEASAERVLSDIPGEPGRLRFAHVLIRDALYEGLGAASRVRLHRQLLRALEARYGNEPGPHQAELAHHAIAANALGEAVAYAWRAADHSLELLAYEEAARLYRTALDVPEPTSQEDRCELLLSLAEAHARAGDTASAKAAFVEAAKLARRHDLPGALARAAAGYGGRLAWARAGDDEQMVRLLEEGLAGVRESDLELRATLLARLAGALRDEPARERRDALSREAVELARRSANASTLSYALDGRAAAIVAHDTAEELLAVGAELREVAHRSGDPEKELAGRIWRFHAQLFLGEFHAAASDLADADRLAQELRQPVQLWLVCANRAMLSLATGGLSQARELIEDALALGEHAQPHGAIPIYWFQRFTLSDFVGGLEEITPALQDLVLRYPARVMFRCAAAYLDARLGRLEAARGALHALAADDFSGVPIDQEWLYGTSFLAEVAAILGDAACAAALYPLLLPWARLSAADVSEGIRGSVARYLGLLATTLGRCDEAADHFVQALDANEQMGAMPWLAHTRRDYAQLLLARNEPGDPEQGLELIREAIATYRRLGMRASVAGADELRRALETLAIAPA